jgi:hypothetical protein
VTIAFRRVLIQVFSYGISLTTPFGFWLRWFGRLFWVVAAFYPQKRPRTWITSFPYYLTVVVAALVVTLINTGVSILDALIIGYPVLLRLA